MGFQDFSHHFCFGVVVWLAGDLLLVGAGLHCNRILFVLVHVDESTLLLAFFSFEVFVAEQVIRDGKGKMIGRLVMESNGEVKLYGGSAMGYLGYYSPKDNKTRDRTGAVQGYGNVLTSLLRG